MLCFEWSVSKLYSFSCQLAVALTAGSVCCCQWSLAGIICVTSSRSKTLSDSKSILLLQVRSHISWSQYVSAFLPVEALRLTRVLLSQFMCLPCVDIFTFTCTLCNVFPLLFVCLFICLVLHDALIEWRINLNMYEGRSINKLQNSVILLELMEWHRFVTYLWNNPRT